MYEKALTNIQLVYPKNNCIDFTDINELIYEEILGIHITYINKESIDESLLKVDRIIKNII